MRSPLRMLIPAGLVLLALTLLPVTLLAQSDSDDSSGSPAAEERDEQPEGEEQARSQPNAEPRDEASERASTDPGFTPTERLRWDQEVDYPTDI